MNINLRALRSDGHIIGFVDRVEVYLDEKDEKLLSQGSIIARLYRPLGARLIFKGSDQYLVGPCGFWKKRGLKGGLEEIKLEIPMFNGKLYIEGDCSKIDLPKNSLSLFNKSRVNLHFKDQSNPA